MTKKEKVKPARKKKTKEEKDSLDDLKKKIKHQKDALNKILKTYSNEK